MADGVCYWKMSFYNLPLVCRLLTTDIFLNRVCSVYPAIVSTSSLTTLPMLASATRFLSLLSSEVNLTVSSSYFIMVSGKSDDMEEPSIYF